MIWNDKYHFLKAGNGGPQKPPTLFPYHPTLLMLQGAHMDLQHIMHAELAKYVLKYALKAD